MRRSVASPLPGRRVEPVETRLRSLTPMTRLRRSRVRSRRRSSRRGRTKSAAARRARAPAAVTRPRRRRPTALVQFLARTTAPVRWLWPGTPMTSDPANSLPGFMSAAAPFATLRRPSPSTRTAAARSRSARVGGESLSPVACRPVRPPLLPSSSPFTPCPFELCSRPVPAPPLARLCIVRRLRLASTLYSALLDLRPDSHSALILDPGLSSHLGFEFLLICLHVSFPASVAILRLSSFSAPPGGLKP